MARYVDDLTMAYNVIKGAHWSAPYTAPTPQAHPERIEVKKLRCAVFTAGGGNGKNGNGKHTGGYRNGRSG